MSIPSSLGWPIAFFKTAILAETCLTENRILQILRLEVNEKMYRRVEKILFRGFI